METDRLTEQLVALAAEHRLTVIEEPGLSAPCYRLMASADARAYLALVYDWKPERLH